MITVRVRELARAVDRAYVAEECPPDEAWQYALPDDAPAWMHRVVQARSWMVDKPYQPELVQEAVWYIAEDIPMSRWTPDCNEGPLGAWLMGDAAARGRWVNIAVEEGGYSDLFSVLALAQRLEWEECYETVLQALQDVALSESWGELK